jgi:hypothetical protein
MPTEGLRLIFVLRRSGAGARSARPHCGGSRKDKLARAFNPLTKTFGLRIKNRCCWGIV